MANFKLMSQKPFAKLKSPSTFLFIWYIQFRMKPICGKSLIGFNESIMILILHTSTDHSQVTTELLLLALIKCGLNGGWLKCLTSLTYTDHFFLLYLDGKRVWSEYKKKVV